MRICLTTREKSFEGGRNNEIPTCCEAWTNDVFREASRKRTDPGKHCEVVRLIFLSCLLVWRLQNTEGTAVITV